MRKKILKLGRTTLSMAVFFLLVGFLGKSYFSADSITTSSSSEPNVFIVVIEFAVFLAAVSIACFYFAFIRKESKKF